MGYKILHIVVHDLHDKYLGGGIIYMGYDEEKANYHYMQTPRSDWYQFHQIDSSIIEEEKK